MWKKGSTTKKKMFSLFFALQLVTTKKTHRKHATNTCYGQTQFKTSLDT